MKLADVSIKRPVFATMIIGALVVLGIFSYPNVSVNLMPSVDFPIITVTTVYPGADPSVIEKKVIDKIEEAVNTISGIKILRSTCLENLGQVIIQFKLSRKSSEAAQDVRDTLASIQRQLPKDLELPVVKKFDIGSMPILSIALSGQIPIGKLTKIAKDLKETIQKISGVGGITLVGEKELEAQIQLKRNRLAAFNLVGNDVVRALQAGNLEIPGGRIEGRKREFSVKMKGEVSSLKQIEELVVTNILGRFIKIKDVATVKMTTADARSSSSLNGRSAIAIVIRKKSGTNTVAIAHDVRKLLKKVRKTLPKGVSMAVPVDNAEFIERSIHDVQFDLFFAGLLTVFIIFFFLHDMRSTFISAIAIPTSVIATFTFVRFMGFSFNNMTMLALTLSIGILVDDAIVVLENIHRHIMEEGKDPYTAASVGTAEIGLAVMASTFSIAAVFLPVAFMDGILGRFFYEFGMTVSFAILVSMLVSFTLTPMLSSIMLKSSHGEKNILFRGIDKVLDGLDSAYAWLIRQALRFRFSTVLIAFALLIGSFLLVPYIGAEFAPQEDRGEFAVYVELPESTNLETTSRVCERVADFIRKVPEVTNTLVTIGGGAQGKVNLGQIQVKLVSFRKRSKSQKQMLEQVREMLRSYNGAQGANLTVQIIDAVGGSAGFRSQQIQYNLRGTDFQSLSTAAQEILKRMKKTKGFVDLDYTYRGGKPEYAILPDRKRAGLLKVPLASIGLAVRTQLEGSKVSEFQRGQERYDIRLRLQKSQRQRISDVGQIKVRNLEGKVISLGNLIKVKREKSPAQIERQGRQRQITVLANLEGIALAQAMAKVEAIAKQVVPASVSTSWAGQAEIMQESAFHMLTALSLAVIFVYMILASQFNSFLHPFTIMMSLPFSFIGVFGGLFLAGMSINVFTMIGVIMLMGLVTKTAILLVDYANTMREQGMDIDSALILAGRVRLRPILMTTGATIFGMLPVALGLSEGGEQRAPMAVCVIGGLITSTMLTLVVVPVVYRLVDRFSRNNYPKPEGSAQDAREPSLEQA